MADMTDPSRKIILYHYSFSPYARRITWYLNLRKIPYLQCIQPPIMPRPDVAALGTNYRRIPILSIGRDVYLDTRLILSKLETLFPPSSTHPSITSTSPQHKTTRKLLEHWAIDSGLFNRAATLIPSDTPLMKDPKFTKDREDFFPGRKYSRERVERERPEALVEVYSAFEFLENTVLVDGRQWVLGDGEGPTLADIEVWPFHWLRGLKGALPAGYISEKQFPRTYQWLERFDAVVMTAMKSNGAAKKISGSEAVKMIAAGGFAEAQEAIHVDENDPSGLNKGEMVEVWPIDSGSTRRDRGRLLGLGTESVVIEGKMEGGQEVRIHAPRHGFRVRRVKEEKL